MDAIRRSLIDAGRRALLPACRRLSPQAARILMYHRFSRHEQPRAMSAECFEGQLRHLVKHYQPMPLAEMVRALRAGTPLPNNSVAVTIDDGYADSVEIAAPLLEKYRVPATIFVVTRFIDQTIWLWYDAVRHIIFAARDGTYEMTLVGEHIRLNLDSSAASREAAWNRICDAWLQDQDQEHPAKIARLATIFGVTLPDRPTKAFRAANWASLRELDAELFEIGSHTLTHPILSRCSDSRIRDELALSKREVEAAIQRTALSFCYPNGMAADFDTRCVETAKSIYECAVSAYGGLADERSDPFALPRVGAPLEWLNFAWELAGYSYLRRQVTSRR